MRNLIFISASAMMLVACLGASDSHGGKDHSGEGDTLGAFVPGGYGSGGHHSGGYGFNSHGPGGYGFVGHSFGGHGPGHSYRDLAQLEEFIHDVGSEKLQLRDRVKMLKAQKLNLLKKLEWIRQDVIPVFWASQQTQDSDLRHIKEKIKALLHSVGEHEGVLAGEMELASEQENLVVPRWVRINTLAETANKQQAFLAKLEFLLEEAKDKLHEKLNVSETEAENEITELKYNTLALTEWTNTRHCYKGSVVVEINKNGTALEEVYYPPDFFHDLTPTAFCDLHGFTAYLNPHRSHSFGYADTYQNLGVTLDCKPSIEHVAINVIDSSKGDFNEMKSVSVHFKLCTFGPQASEWG